MGENKSSSERQYKYLAFISYRHLSPDAEIAEAVQEELEKFKVPSALDPEGKYKEIRIFRDRDELTTQDLSESLDEALMQSEYLIVISSKRTKLSQWCVREVELFKETHSSRNIIPILIEGEPYESFSEPLKNLSSIEVDDKGNEKIKSLDLLAADLRPDEVKDPDFIGYEELAKTNKNELNQHIKTAKKILKNSEIYRIMATVLGVNYGDLKQRHKERQMKLKMRLGILAATILTIFGIAMTSMFIRAVNSERTATSQIALMTLKTADQANKTGDRAYALLLSNEAMKNANKKMDNYKDLNANYERVLNDALLTDKYSSILMLKTGTSSPFFDLLKEGKYIVTNNQKNNLVIAEISTGKIIKELEFSQPVKATRVRKSDNSIFVATSDNKLYQINPETFEIKDLNIKNPFFIHQIDFTNNEEYLFAIDSSKNIAIYSMKDFSLVKQFTTEESIYRIDLLKDKNQFILNTSDGKIELFDIKTGKMLQTIRKSKEKIQYIASSMSKDGKKYAFADEGIIYVYDISKGFKEPKKVDIGLYTGNILLSHDGKYLYYSSMSFINVKNLENDEFVKTIPVGEGGVYRLKLNNKGDTLYFDYSNKNVIGTVENVNDKSYDADVIISEGSSFDDRIISFVSTKDDKYLVVNSQDAKLKVLSTENKVASKVLNGSIKAVSEDRNILLLIDQAHKMSIYNFKEEKHTELGAIAEYFNTIYNVHAVSDKHDYFAFSDISNKNIRVYNSKGELIYSTQAEKDPVKSPFIIDISIFSDKNLLLSLDELGIIRVYNLKTGELIKELKDKDERADKLVYSKDASLIGISYYGNTGTIFNLETGKVTDRIEGELLTILGENGKLESVYGQKNTFFLKYKNGKTELYATNDDGKGISTKMFNEDFVSYDNKYLLTNVNNETLVVTDIETGFRVRTLKTQGSVNSKGGVMNSDSSKIAYEPIEYKTYIADFYTVDELKKMSEEKLKGRELTETEKIELGFKSKVNNNE